MPSLDLGALTKAQIKYQKEFRLLPFVSLKGTLGNLGINLYPNVQYKDVAKYFLRKSGIMKPYNVGLTVANSNVGKAVESVLEVQKAYASVKDNVWNYYQKEMIAADELLGANKTKTNMAWERVMISSVVKTFGEDVVDALFFGERDLADQTPLGCFSGFETKILALIFAGDIAVLKGNMHTTGALANNPSTGNGYEVLTALLAMYRAAHPALRKEQTVMMVTTEVGDMYDDAYSAKFHTKPIVDQFNRTELFGSGGKCKLVRDTAMGTGDRVILTIPGNFDFGMNTESDMQFVQVRLNHYDDPNDVNFWIQADFGSRINSVDKKVFLCNEQTLTSVPMSGDYS